MKNWGGISSKMTRVMKNWLKDREGTTAIEFAMIAMPFTYLLIAIVEISLMMTAFNLLQAGTGEVSRMIRTGALQQEDAASQEVLFAQALCDRIEAFIPCDNVEYEVVPMESFSQAATYEASFDSEGGLVSGGFALGGPTDIMLIRTVYRYPLMTPFFAQVMADGPGNTRLLMSTQVMEVEPYDDNQTGVAGG